MTQLSNRSDNVIALPQNKSLTTRKAFFKEKNLVNYLAWFAASIDCHLVTTQQLALKWS